MSGKEYAEERKKMDASLIMILIFCQFTTLTILQSSNVKMNLGLIAVIFNVVVFFVICRLLYKITNNKL